MGYMVAAKAVQKPIDVLLARIEGVQTHRRLEQALAEPLACAQRAAFRGMTPELPHPRPDLHATPAVVTVRHRFARRPSPARDLELHGGSSGSAGEVVHEAGRNKARRGQLGGVLADVVLGENRNAEQVLRFSQILCRDPRLAKTLLVERAVLCRERNDAPEPRPLQLTNPIPTPKLGLLVLLEIRVETGMLADRPQWI